MNRSKSLVYELFSVLHASYVSNLQSSIRSFDFSSAREDTELSEALDALERFLRNSEIAVLTFDGKDAPLLTPPVRAKVHKVCDQLQVFHESIGKGENRFLVVSKQTPTFQPSTGLHVVQEYLYCDTYYAIKGPLVDAVARHYTPLLAPSVLEKRQKRDGVHHHITVAFIRDLVETELSAESVFEKLQVVPDDWEPRGVGLVRNDKNHAAIFVLVHWPAATALLKELGLPEQHFHITLGFQHEDIHTVPKTAETLVSDELLPSLRAIEAIEPEPSPKKTPTKKKQKKAQQSATENPLAES